MEIHPPNDCIIWQNVYWGSLALNWVAGQSIWDLVLNTWLMHNTKIKVLQA